MAKSIMVLGTMSNVGKSVIAAGLCRVFMQDGYRVAPFKSQNMALNSFITKDGLEMGRAQVMQAECAGKEPDVRMNPILLKPTSDSGSQVIVNGQVVGNMSAEEYYRYKNKLAPAIKKTYDSLAAENDIIVLEGAGSPAEINLMAGDIVNMGLAAMVKAPCLLVGDIDRGGVFAALYGTIALLKGEPAMIKGVVINKFRGDINILKPGLDKLEELVNLPVLGVVPHRFLDIDDEDSLSDRLGNGMSQSPGLIDIAVIRLPRISNFTDFNAFQNISGVSLRYVGAVKELRDPDLILLPGTKNTMADLLWLRQSGLESEIIKKAHGGTPVFGICGGFQMLGLTLTDNEGFEMQGTLPGLGLLNCHTVFEPEKIRTRVSGTFQGVSGALSGLSGLSFEGYEIHMGRTLPEAGNGVETAAQFTTIREEQGLEKADGLQSANIYGSYVHGIFDQEGVAEALIRSLCRQKGIDFEKIGDVSQRGKKEQEYDKLAQIIRDALDMKKIYQIMEEGV